MECPRCAKGWISKPVYSGDCYSSKYTKCECRHCYGTGKIKFHDIWMCKIIKYDTTLPLICEEIFWCHGTKYWNIDEVEPIARMEEIE